MAKLINYKLNDAAPFKISSKEGVRCQAGGAQQHTLSTTASYGYTGSRGFKTDGYAPITKDVTAHNQCGGKKRKKRRRKNQSRKKSQKKNHVKVNHRGGKRKMAQT